MSIQIRFCGLAVVVALLVGGLAASAAPVGTRPSLRTDGEQFSYAFGMSLAQKWRENGVELDPAALAQAVRDVQSGGQTALTDNQAQEVFTRLGQKFRAEREAHRKQVAQTNLLAGQAFLARNKAQPGVVSLPSGLQYKILSAGRGPNPDPTNFVSLKFRELGLDGMKPAGERRQWQTRIYSVNGVMRGWNEALLMMKPQARWLLCVPPALAYGEEGGPEAGPNETLVFELELEAVLPGPPPPTAQDIAHEKVEED